MLISQSAHIHEYDSGGILISIVCFQASSFEGADSRLQIMPWRLLVNETESLFEEIFMKINWIRYEYVVIPTLGLSLGHATDCYLLGL